MEKYDDEISNVRSDLRGNYVHLHGTCETLFVDYGSNENYVFPTTKAYVYIYLCEAYSKKK